MFLNPVDDPADRTDLCACGANLGFDLIWFGLVVVLTEIGLITIGLNVFVLKGC